MCYLFLLLGTVLAVNDAVWAEKSKQPSPATIRTIAARHLAQKEGYKSGDLITKKDVPPILKQLATSYGQVPDQKKILEDLLSDTSVLASYSSTARGGQFMRKVACDKLIFDRLDRISRVSGGKALLRDIAKLPDGPRYAKLKHTPGVPNLLDLLPKNRSGKTRTVKNYKKPTGRIYTQKDLVERITKSYANVKNKKK